MNRQKVKIGDYCQVIKGAIGIKKATPGKYPLVVTAEARLSHNEYQFDNTAVIIPLVSSSGHGHASIKRLHYQEGKFALGTILCAIIVNDTSVINPRYLFLYLSYFKDHLLVPLMKGAANVTLSIKKIKSVEIILPSLDRQLEIIELESNNKVLKNFKSEIGKQKELVSKLKQSILKEAIQGKLTERWRKNNSNTETVSELLKDLKIEKEKLIVQKKIKKTHKLHLKAKNEPAFNVPKTWVRKRFWDVIWCYRGHNPPKSNFIKSPKDGYVRFVQITDFKTNKNAVYVPISHKLKMVKKGEILMAAYRHIGKLSREMEGAFNVALCKINCIEPFDIDFLEILISSPLVKGELLSESGRSHIPSMHSDHLLSLWIPIPPLEEQQIIVKKYKALIQKCDKIEKEILEREEYSKMLMQAILKEAFESKTKKETKVIELPIKPTNIDYYKRTLLATEIVWQLQKEPTLGHLKLQKLIYLAQESSTMQLPTNFLQQVAGPYDPKMARSLDKQMKTKKWFEYKKTELLKFKPLEKAGEHKADFDKFFVNEKESIQYIIDIFKTAKSDSIELVGTLYACWKKLIEEKQMITDELISKRFYEWSEEKAKFEPNRIIKALRWMVKKGIVPEKANA